MLRKIIPIYPVVLYLIASASLLGCSSSPTIGHEILKQEAKAMAITDAELAAKAKMLDDIATEAIDRINRLHVDDRTPHGVKRIFDEIDSVLVERNYVVFINTTKLSDAFAPGVPAAGGATVLTDKMRARQSQHPDAARFRFDCDTGSFIYLDILQRLGKPVVMFETPKHNCIRWKLSPTEHVNWDVNDAASYTDEEHRQGMPRTAGPIDPGDERRAHYLSDMSLPEVYAYHRAIMAAIYRDRGKLDEAIECYELSIEGRPYVAMPRNNLAWMIATQEKLQTKELHDLALTMALSAVEIEPMSGMYIDTLAAVYAARHEFEKAIEIENGEHGRKDAGRLKAYRDRKTPVDLEWKKEPDA